jgi:membrane protein required for colicin V production
MLKGYVICVCIFSLLNWFYPHENWPIKAEGSFSFEKIYKGSKFLVKEFPNSEDYYDGTKEKIKDI